VKRWLRELVRLELLPALRVASYDVAIRSRPNAYDASLDDLAVDIAQVVRQTRGAVTR